MSAADDIAQSIRVGKADAPDPYDPYDPYDGGYKGRDVLSEADDREGD